MKYTVFSHRSYCSHSEECAVSLSYGKKLRHERTKKNTRELIIIIIIIVVVVVIMN